MKGTNVTFASIPQYGVTTRATNSVLINPFQDLVDGGAAYVHEMAHIAGKDETGVRLV